jgi:preprotein translocase subunit SecG
VTIDTDVSRLTFAPPPWMRLQRVFFAVCVIAAPLLMIVSVLLNPARNVVNGGGEAVIAANMNVGGAADALRVVVTVLEVVFLPFGALGMAVLAVRRSPWLGTVGGFLALTGVTALVLFAGQDRLSYLMARQGGGHQMAVLWDAFNSDVLVTSFLYIFIIGHLFGPMLLGIGLGRTRVIPAWAAVAIVARTPLQIIGFLTHIGLTIEIATYGLLLAGSIPVAIALVRFADDRRVTASRSVGGSGDTVAA